MRRSYFALLVTIGLILVAPTLWSGQAIVVKPLADTELPESGVTLGARTDCQVGNLNPAAGLVTGFFQGNERYKYLIYPPDQCSCPVGFLLESVSMMLHFEPWMVPITFDVVCDLGEAIEVAPGCWEPGPIDYCVSSVTTFHITTAGYHTITVPMDGCDCAFMDHHYFIGLEFLTAFDANIVIDAFPQPCIVYNWRSPGPWEDLFTWFARSSGKGIIWGDIICCQPPVATEADSWGAIKSLYH
jgi:hypothetical protein